MITQETSLSETLACPPIADHPDIRQAYLELLKRSLVNGIYAESEIKPYKDGRWTRRMIVQALNRFASRRRQLILIEKNNFDPALRMVGRDWPPYAHTMVGLKRLNNIQFCLEQAFKDGVEGDLIEAGTWRGGASIFMRAMMKLFGESDRTLWVADSFAGLPSPNAEKYPADANDLHHFYEHLAVSLEKVKENFAKYGLLDENVRFLKGWFSETLPTAPVEKLAVIRADGDMYESTMDTLVNLYPKLNVGGFLIIDDYLNPNTAPCRQAVDNYRKEHSISEEIHPVDWTGAYWRRSSR